MLIAAPRARGAIDPSDILFGDFSRASSSAPLSVFDAAGKDFADRLFELGFSCSIGGNLPTQVSEILAFACDLEAHKMRDQLREELLPAATFTSYGSASRIADEASASTDAMSFVRRLDGLACEKPPDLEGSSVSLSEGARREVQRLCERFGLEDVDPLVQDLAEDYLIELWSRDRP